MGINSSGEHISEKVKAFAMKFSGHTMKFKSRKGLANSLDKLLKFKCDYCEKAFARKCSLDEHILSHTGEKPFPCAWCDKTYKTYRSLKSHWKVHGRKNCVRCPKCDQIFYSKIDMLRHKMTHNTTNHICKVCSKKFKSKKRYIRHGCPFECEQCGRWFDQYMKYLSHRRKQHQAPSTDFNNYKKSGKISIVVNNNLITDFNDSVSMKSKTVYGDEQHECRLCYKEFCDEISLILHINVHGDGDPCKCMVCGLTFPTEIVRTYHHMRQHTGDINWQNLESGKKVFESVYHLHF